MISAQWACCFGFLLSETGTLIFPVSSFLAKAHSSWLRGILLFRSGPLALLGLHVLRKAAAKVWLLLHPLFRFLACCFDLD